MGQCITLLTLQQENKESEEKDTTKITELLNEFQKKEFDRLMYGADEKSGLQGKLPAWTDMNDVGIDCICCLLILKGRYDLSGMSNNQLYKAYCKTMDFINEEYPDIPTSGSIFNRDVFAKFVNAYPQIIGGCGCMKEQIIALLDKADERRLGLILCYIEALLGLKEGKA